MTANMPEFLSRSKTVEKMVLRLNSKDTNVPRSKFPECGSSKCSGILGTGTQIRYNSGGNEKCLWKKQKNIWKRKAFLTM